MHKWTDGSPNTYGPEVDERVPHEWVERVLREFQIFAWALVISAAFIAQLVDGCREGDSYTLDSLAGRELRRSRVLIERRKAVRNPSTAVQVDGEAENEACADRIDERYSENRRPVKMLPVSLIIEDGDRARLLFEQRHLPPELLVNRWPDDRSQRGLFGNNKYFMM